MQFLLLDIAVTKLTQNLFHLKGAVYSMEEVMIKNEPVETESTENFHSKCEDSLSIGTSESPTALFEDLALETVNIKSEVDLGDYECTPSSDNTLSQLGQTVEHKIIDNLKTFGCDQCDATYSNQNNLQIHKRKHSGSKPFVCDECGNAFYRSEYLTRHKRVWHRRSHTAERRYACDLCEKTYIRKDSLIQHKRLHSGERPYSCDVCGFRFNQTGHARKHMLTQHGDKNSRAMNSV